MKLALVLTNVMPAQLFQATFDFTALDMILMWRAQKIGLFSQPDSQDEAAALTCMQRIGARESKLDRKRIACPAKILETE